MSGISLQALALVEAWQKVARSVIEADARRNGRSLPPSWDRALSECRAAACVAYVVSADPVPGTADGTNVDTTAEPLPRFEEIDVRTAAARLGIRERAVRKRITHGQLEARKVGRVWLVKQEVING